MKQDEETQNMIPIHDRDKLLLVDITLVESLLMKPLRHIIQTWMHGDMIQNCRKRWNIEVFSKIEEFIGIEIEDDESDS